MQQRLKSSQGSKPSEFQVVTRITRVGEKGKLSPRFIGPFEIQERVGLVAYKLDLPLELSALHDTFHVSNLKKSLSMETVVLPLEEVQINEQLRITEEPIEILDQEVKQLRRNTNCQGPLELKAWTRVYLRTRSFCEEQVPPPVYKRACWLWQIKENLEVPKTARKSPYRPKVARKPYNAKFKPTESSPEQCSPKQKVSPPIIDSNGSNTESLFSQVNPRAVRCEEILAQDPFWETNCQKQLDNSTLLMTNLKDLRPSSYESGTHSAKKQDTNRSGEWYATLPGKSPKGKSSSQGMYHHHHPNFNASEGVVECLLMSRIDTQIVSINFWKKWTERFWCGKPSESLIIHEPIVSFKSLNPGKPKSNIVAALKKKYLRLRKEKKYQKSREYKKKRMRAEKIEKEFVPQISHRLRPILKEKEKMLIPRVHCLKVRLLHCLDHY
ncbi:LOW QUALITY PROTEIN: hypothetical protein OSB04_016863 [Centaurea solstitialis]|uniref:Tf2-1-like SH3-like domain-containing protein n=1 Tax=Centaurea solstitialis TaxID=347529 RepID=A0AA38TLU8_9ASTR|nr:LOW QUALITY PROTEIN: hypothetical protein OSB04_016863 [Centaurea solstitialis]